MYPQICSPAAGVSLPTLMVSSDVVQLCNLGSSCWEENRLWEKAVRSLFRASEGLSFGLGAEEKLRCFASVLSGATAQVCLCLVLHFADPSLALLTSWFDLQTSSSPQSCLANTGSWMTVRRYHHFVQFLWTVPLLVMSLLCQPCHPPVGLNSLAGNHPSLPPESDRSCLW